MLKDEGVKSIFDREELKQPESVTVLEEVEHRTVKTIDSEGSGMLILSNYL